MILDLILELLGGILYVKKRIKFRGQKDILFDLIPRVIGGPQLSQSIHNFILASPLSVHRTYIDDLDSCCERQEQLPNSPFNLGKTRNRNPKHEYRDYNKAKS